MLFSQLLLYILHQLDLHPIGAERIGLRCYSCYFLMTLRKRYVVLFSGQAPKVTKGLSWGRQYGPASEGKSQPPSCAVRKAYAPAIIEPEPARCTWSNDCFIEAEA